jgi:uncharacterized cofD-like protein
MKRWAERGSYWQWLAPGMGVKRWILLLTVGLIVAALGLAICFELVRSVGPVALPAWLGWPVVVLLLGLGGALVVVALTGFNRSLLSAFRRTGQGDVVDVVYRHRHRRRGPKVVAIGGGHGLNTLLRGLKEHTDNITAIVTVADDGGSSGRLRRDLGMLPPGDFRNCIAALSDAEGLLAELFQYRFGDDSGLGGHSFGNLYITAMAAITGSFESALVESSHVLAVRGRVIPSTLVQANLCAEVWVEAAAAPAVAGAAAQGGQWRYVCGESRIPTVGGRIRRVYLEPEDSPAYPEAIRAILDADLIVAGPGSLYTSVLPNLLVQDLAQAIRVTRAPKVYVCNVATQPGETDGYDVTMHMEALREHVGTALFRTALANSTFRTDRSPGGGAEFVRLPQGGSSLDYQLVGCDLVDEEHPWRHDSAKLARAVMAFVKP